MDPQKILNLKEKSGTICNKSSISKKYGEETVVSNIQRHCAWSGDMKLHPFTTISEFHAHQKHPTDP
jgi:hypothetical protein